MSGSRAIVLSLSVRDADVVRQQLVQMGEQGEAALQRLDAAAQRTAGRGGVGAFSQSTREAGENTGRFGQALGSAGYQIQDFAVQVQMGQNAISAFGAQASQFLGVFGTGGAIAGAVLTVGLLAYQLLSLGEEGDDAANAIDTLAKSMEDAARDADRLATMLARVEARFMSAIEAGRQRRIRDLNAEVTELSRLENDATLRALNFSRDAQEAANQAQSRRGQLAPEYGLSLSEQQALQREIAEFEGRAASARADAERARRDALRFGFNRQRNEALILGEVTGDTNSNPGTMDRDPPPREGRPEREGPQHDAHLRSQEQEMRRMAAERDRLIRDNETALERYNRRIDEITALAEHARLHGNPIPEETIRRATDAALADFERMEQATERTSQFANQLGFSFSSAFEDAIIKGKSFSEVLKGLEQDIARIIVRAAITQPFGNALAGGVNSLMGSFSFGNAFAGPSGAGSGNTFATVAATGGTFAMGGIMTPNGPLPLNRYASGGIANSPQIALFGEGRMPEAYVPLPDGRRIPVAMQGGGGVTFAPTYNIDARGADASMVPRLRAEMVAIARASNAELLDSIQRGGSAARIVGRRA